MSKSPGNSGSDNSSGSGAPPFVWAVGGFLLGAAVTLVFSWFTFMAPLLQSVQAREKAATQWDELNRSERQVIQDLKNMSADEMQKWVAAVSEQNARFADIERNLHRQEMSFATDGTSYLWIVAVVVLGSILGTAYLVRDKNSASDTTLENIAALSPRQMISVAQQHVTDRSQLPTGSAKRALPKGPGN